MFSCFLSHLWIWLGFSFRDPFKTTSLDWKLFSGSCSWAEVPVSPRETGSGWLAFPPLYRSFHTLQPSPQIMPASRRTVTVTHLERAAQESGLVMASGCITAEANSDRPSSPPLAGLALSPAVPAVKWQQHSGCLILQCWGSRTVTLKVLVYVIWNLSSARVTAVTWISASTLTDATF